MNFQQSVNAREQNHYCVFIDAEDDARVARVNFMPRNMAVLIDSYAGGFIVRPPVELDHRSHFHFIK